MRACSPAPTTTRSSGREGGRPGRGLRRRERHPVRRADRGTRRAHRRVPPHRARSPARLGHRGAGRPEPGPPPTRILVHDYLTVNGTTIAKSGAQAADPTELVASYGADAVRWWLLRASAPAASTDFTVERLVRWPVTTSAAPAGRSSRSRRRGTAS